MIVPQLREDIEVEEFYENDTKFVALSDHYGIALQPIALPINIFDFLKYRCTDLDFDSAESEFSNGVGKAYPEGFISNMLNYLEQQGYLDTPLTRLYKEDITAYLNSDTRPPVCAGNSYPLDYEELKKYLNTLLSATTEEPAFKATKILAPHIDFRIGSNAHKIYANTFNALDTDFDLAIILGTAHYKSSDDFMFTKKDFQTPLGKVETDKEFISQLESNLDFDITYDDLAHKPEHSIELHLILLQYMMAMQNKEFKIVPILTGSYHNYFEDGVSPENNDNYKNMIEKLEKTISGSGKKVVYLCSGDLSHTGRKFNHPFDAKEKIKETEESDNKIINQLLKSDAESFYKGLASIDNFNNVCGLSPLYSLMKIANTGNGHLTGYHNWQEYETESSVSFCGIIYK